MKPPKRRVTLRIEIGGDTWEDAADALEAISQRIHQHGPISDLVSGGWSAGYSVVGSEDPSQTGDKFRRENKEYVAWLRSSRPQ